jgi:hypothetical protein
MSMEDKTPRGAYRGRQNVRQVAQDIVDELVTQWPGTTVAIDLDGTDEEDAYLWISANEPANRDRVALTALELVNAFGARMGFWIVPRVLNRAEDKEESAHRLRLVRPDEQSDGRNALHRG